MSISIGSNTGLNSITANLSTLENTNKLESKLKNNLENSTDKELMEVCKSFEAYFVEQMFKEMKKTVPDSGEEENQYKTFFEDMLYQEYSDDISENGNMGIAQLLYDSMKRNG